MVWLPKIDVYPGLRRSGKRCPAGTELGHVSGTRPSSPMLSLVASNDYINGMRQYFGDEFLAYVLNCSTSDLESNTLSDVQREAAERLLTAAPAHFYDETHERELGRTQMLAPRPDSSTGFATELRMSCGGDVATPLPNDDLEAALFELVRDFFPLTLMPMAGSTPWPFNFVTTAMMTALYSHPATGSLRAAITSDSTLRNLFPTPAEDQSFDTNPTSVAMWASGSGGTVRLGDTPGNMLSYVLTLGQMNRETQIWPYFTIARDGISKTRHLARREVVRMPVFVGLSNLRFSDANISCELTVGTVTPATESMQSLFTRNSRGLSPTAVLHLIIEEQLLEVQSASESGLMSLDKRELDQRFRHLNELIMRACYSFVLTSKPGRTLGPNYHSTLRLNPLRFPEMTSLAYDDLIAIPLATVDPNLASEVAAASLLIARAHQPSLDIAMKRLLTAVTGRQDPSDAFIDAVMCWENLFGDTPETRFKVCASMSLLLCPADLNARRTTFRRLMKLYDLRSKLVHGVSELDADKAHDLRMEAIYYTIDALRVAYSNTNLLRCGSSVERSKLMLLGYVDRDNEG